MAEWTLSSAVKRYIAMELYVKETAQSIEDNTTTLHWELRGWYTTTDASYWYSDTQNDISISINGSAVFTRAYNSGIRISIGTDHPESNKLVIASGDVTVPHNTDGSKSCAVSWAISHHWNSATYAWGSESNLDLTMIARASQPSCITYPSTTENVGDMGGTITIHTNPASSNFRHILRYSWYNKTGTIASDVQYNASWTIPKDFANDVPNANSSWGTIYCDTYLDGTYIGTKSVTFTCTVPEYQIGWGTGVEEAADIPEGISGYVQYYSRLRIKTTAYPLYNSTIQSCEVLCEGKIYTGMDITTEILQVSGTDLTYTVTLIDSRGRKFSGQVWYDVAAYKKPDLTSLVAYRCKSDTDWTADTEGAYICIAPRGAITALSDQNTKKCTIGYKKSAVGYYSTEELAMSTYTLTEEYMIIPADTASGYDIYAELTDSFQSVRRYAIPVMAASAFMQIWEDDAGKKTGLTIGKEAEGDGFDVGWDAIFRKNIDWQGCEGVYFEPTTNLPSDTVYNACVGYYYKLGKMVFCMLAVQINTVPSYTPSSILINLPEALTLYDTWIHGAIPVAEQWQGKISGILKPVGGKAQLEFLPTDGLADGMNLAYGTYLFIVKE